MRRDITVNWRVIWRTVPSKTNTTWHWLSYSASG